jgi:hypothetical protein
MAILGWLPERDSVRKADRPPAPMRGVAEATDVAAGA